MTFVVAVGVLVLFLSDLGMRVGDILDGLTSQGSPRIVGLEGPTIAQRARVSCPEPGVTHVLDPYVVLQEPASRFPAPRTSAIFQVTTGYRSSVLADADGWASDLSAGKIFSPGTYRVRLPIDAGPTLVGCFALPTTVADHPDWRIAHRQAATKPRGIGQADEYDLVHVIGVEDPRQTVEERIEVLRHAIARSERLIEWSMERGDQRHPRRGIAKLEEEIALYEQQMSELQATLQSRTGTD